MTVPPEAGGELTAIEHLQLAWNMADWRKRSAGGGPEAREFALAMTAIEDAQMRFNRGVARQTGNFRPADVEKDVAAAAAGDLG